MARREVPKEDLVRDATAFAVRVEFRRTPDAVDWIFVGLRADGGGSVYFGDDEFYAFNSKKELRRAFVDGRLLRAENGRLIAMRRERSAGESVLESAELEPDDRNRFSKSAESLLRGVAAAVREGRFVACRSAGDLASDCSQVREWLSSVSAQELVIAQRPNAD